MDSIKVQTIFSDKLFYHLDSGLGLDVSCFNIVLATDFVQTLNESKDFDLEILYLHVFAILYFFETLQFYI